LTLTVTPHGILKYSLTIFYNTLMPDRNPTRDHNPNPNPDPKS